MRHALLIAVPLVALIPACATLQDTPAQAYSWELGRKCNTNTMHMSRVEPDGRYWVQGTANVITVAPYFDCMKEQAKRQPYLDWIKARQGASAVQQAGRTGGVPGPSPIESAVSAGPPLAPIWNVGDEWQYAYKGPGDSSGTYVWSVNRVEVLDGAPHYVIKAGTRESFYRVSDLAGSLERVDGVVVLRQTPARLSFAWPLTAGKSWEQNHREERPVDRQTTDRNSLWAVEAEEVVTVPAGAFRTFKVAQRHKSSGVLTTEVWYAPEVKQVVKIREILTAGIRERELIAFKVK